MGWPGGCQHHPGSENVEERRWGGLLEVEMTKMKGLTVTVSGMSLSKITRNVVRLSNRNLKVGTKTETVGVGDQVQISTQH